MECKFESNEDVNGKVTIRVKGSFIGYNPNCFDEFIKLENFLEDRDGEVNMDLSECETFDSLAISLLVKMKGVLATDNRKMSLTGLNRHHREILKKTNLLEYFEYFP